MNISGFLPQLVKVHGEKPAVSIGTSLFCTYEQFSARVAGLAGALRGKLNLQKGDRVGLAMTNAPQYLEILVACWHAGLCAVPMNSKLHPKEFAFILNNAAAKVCFVTDDLAEGIAKSDYGTENLGFIISVDDKYYEALVRNEGIDIVAVSEEDPAWIFYTSGTTGRPKGATLSHRNLMGMALRYYADIDPVSSDDCYLHAAPLSHGGGLYGLPHLFKASHQIIPESRGFDVDEIFDLLEIYENMTFFAAPTMLTRMTNHPRASKAKAENIKTIYYGGAPMYLEDIKRSISVFGPRFYQIFGQGESPMTGVGLSKEMHADSSHPRYEQRLASTGIPRTGVEVRVVNQDDENVAVGELGEILFRSDVTMLGYWNDPEASARALRSGWLHTGDIGFADEEGFITLKDRSKDMIISGGSNIYPREIEEVLMTDQRIDEVSVVGREHSDWGEEVVAFVVPREGETIRAEELDALCLSNIARFKRPKEYFLVDQLPKSNYGKILKTELRKQLAQSPKLENVEI
ncbi:AMP-binding protein [Sneathiella sp. HT1-7]|uniref:AMP-binding protein n=1 Tax=Sneathiella sp. HT1-7 TaxID=2887192 RepID=UPI001D15DA4C|nr:AMP-binding protein [Sneathiella sp. HT1-7]MCC3306199.1 AMP-binding protein [Sneathiella sp. HT1-7]